MHWEICQKVDLALDKPQRVYPECLFLRGDAGAHRWTVELTQAGRALALEGYTVTAMMLRPDGVTVPLTGVVSGSTASVELSADCYAVTGHVTAWMVLSDGAHVVTVAEGRWTVSSGGSDAVVDTEGVIPTLPELLAEIANMRTATAEAEAATGAVRAAMDDMARSAAPGIEQTASGEVVEISDGAARPAVSLLSRISAIQTGSGDPTPDNIRPIIDWDALALTRTGRNMLDPAALTQVQVSTGETRWGMQYTRPGTYALHANAAGGDADYVYARVTDASGAAVGDTLYLVAGSAVKAYTVTLAAGQVLTVWYVRDLDQATAADCLTRTQVQVEMGSRTAYEPAQRAVITAALPETVYGGTLNWTTGVLTVEYELATLDGSHSGFVQSVNSAGFVNAHIDNPLGWVTEGMAVSHFTYRNVPAASVTEECYLAVNGSLYLRLASSRIGGETWDAVKAYLKAQAAAGTPVQVLHQLKEPRTVQLDPQTVELLRGDNRIWSDAGAASVDYIADTKLYIDNAVAAIAASMLNA